MNIGEHTVKSFEIELNELTQSIASLGGMAERLVGDALIAIRTGDIELARKTIDSDNNIDSLQSEIDQKAVSLIARRQPMAVDLREIISAIRLAGDIERIGDLGKNIARRTLALEGKTENQKFQNGLKNLSELTLKQLNQVFDAYIDRDPEQALVVWSCDFEIDQLYHSLSAEVLSYGNNDSKSFERYAQLLFALKNIERIGDHATNIAEIIHYLAVGHTITGKRMRINSFDLGAYN